MPVAVRLFAAFVLVTSTILTGCGGTPTGLPTPTAADAPTVETPATTPDTTAAPDAEAPADSDGSGGAEPTDDPAPSTAADVDPGSTPDTPQSDTATPPALATMTLTPDGLGPLRIGAPVPDHGTPTAMVIWDPDYCREFPHPQGGSTGAFHANYPHTVSPALGSVAPFTVVTAHGESDGTISSMVVFTPEVETTLGLGVGASRTELIAAYPSFDEHWSGPLSDVYALNGDNGRLVFEVAKRATAPLHDYWSDDVLDTVLWMLVVPAGAPAPAIAASDAGGPCAI